MIVVSTQCFPPSPGGIESLMYHLCVELDNAGENIRVYADSSHNTEPSCFDSAQPFTVKRYGGLKTLRRYRKAHAIQRYFKEADVIEGCLLADTWKSLELLDTAHSIRTICLAHGSELPTAPSPRKLRRIRQAYTHADIIVANSHYTAGRLGQYDIAPEKIQVINPGIEAPEPDLTQVEAISSGLSNRFPILITVARLEQRKGHKQVLDTIQELRQRFPEILYLIVGDGSERKNLEQQARQLGISDNVCFTGSLQGPQRDAYLANSNIFVMPGLIMGDDVEGFGMAYIEAACLGIPAVASDSGGSPEAVLHEQTGLVCAAGDQQQLARSLLRLATDTNLRTNLGESARKRAAGFLWAQKIHEYLQLLHPQD